MKTISLIALAAVGAVRGGESPDDTLMTLHESFCMTLPFEECVEKGCVYLDTATVGTATMPAMTAGCHAPQDNTTTTGCATHWECPTTQYWDEAMCGCKDHCVAEHECGDNQHFDWGMCGCKDNCQEHPCDMTTSHFDWGTCGCKANCEEHACGDNQHFDWGMCGCWSCQEYPCGDNQHFDFGICMCTSCASRWECPTTQYWDETMCSCKDHCVAEHECGDNQHFDWGMCGCKDNCQEHACGHNQWFDWGMCGCKDNCQEHACDHNQWFDHTVCTCVHDEMADSASAASLSTAAALVSVVAMRAAMV